MAHKQRPNRTGEAELRRRPAPGRLLLAARRLLKQRGYEALSVAELAAAAGVSRETFYNHFADKRECVAAASDPELARIDSELRRAGELDRAWAASLAAALEETLAGIHGSPDAPRGRLLSAVLDAVASRGWPALRLVEVLEAARVSRPRFYRHFGSLRDCFACACARLIEGLEEDVLGTVAATRSKTSAGSPAAEPRNPTWPLPEERPLALAALGDRLAANPQAARILVVEASHLEPKYPPGTELADARSLTELIARLLGADEAPSDPEPTCRFAVGAIAEAIRSAVIAGELDRLSAQLAGLAETVLAPDHATTAQNGHRRGEPPRRRRRGRSAGTRGPRPAMPRVLR